MLLVTLLALGSIGHDLGQQVNHDLAPGQDVNHRLTTSDGDTVFYTVTEDGFVGGQWFRASTDGSQDAVEISDPLPLTTELYLALLSPDESRIVFTGDLDTDEQLEIYSLATDGSKTLVKLNPPLGGSQDISPHTFQLSLDGTRVVFRVGFSSGPLYSAPIDGSAAATLLNPAPSATVFRVASGYVVFKWDGYYSVPMDGSSAPVQISDTVVQATFDFSVSPDGQRLVYMGITYEAEPDPEFTNPRYWIFGVPVDGSEEPALLFDSVRPFNMFGGPEPMIHFSPDSQWVVHRTDSTPNPNRLYTAPPDASLPPQQLSDGPNGGGVGYDIRFAPDGRVVFDYTENGLPRGIYVVPPDGSAPPQRITQLTTYPVPVKYEVTYGRVVFVGYSNDPITSELRYELYSVPLNGSSPPVKLNPRMVAGGDVVDGNTLNSPSFRISPDGEWVVYVADQQTDGVEEMYVVPTDGRLRARKINRPLPAGAYISPFLFSVLPGSKRVLYAAQQDQLDTYELFTSELGDPSPFLGGSSSVPAGRPIH